MNRRAVPSGDGDGDAARSSTPTRWRRIPVTTIAVAAVGTAAWIFPSLATGLEDRPDASLASGWWRPLSGHLAHGSTHHFLLNIALLVPLLAWRERRVGAARALIELMWLAAAVAIGVRCMHDGWTSYRGLSGVVYGLIARVLVEIAVGASSARRSHASIRWIAAGVVALLAVKTVSECVAGGWLTSSNELHAALGVVYLPGSHLAGLAAGAIAAVVALHANGASRREATARGSSASRSAPMTATPSAPARATSPAASASMPPSA